MTFVCVAPVTAQVIPHPGTGDPHIQTVDYVSDQVVQLATTPGYELTVGLAAGDPIESVAVGDSAAWQVSSNHSGDHLFIKALQGGVSTNMTVVTSTRAYVFDLVSLSAPSPAMAYTVQFQYAAASSATGGPASGEAVAPHQIVGQYQLKGDKALMPAAMDDDGTHTYIQWPADTALPATYFRDDQGAETLANGHMRNGFYVIDSVHQELIFRIDKHDARAVRVLEKTAQ